MKKCPIIKPVKGKFGLTMLHECIEDNCGFWSANSENCGISCLGTLAQEIDSFLQLTKQQSTYK
jgi:hypothetical protein